MLRYYIFLSVILIQSFLFRSIKQTKSTNFIYLAITFIELLFIAGFRSRFVGVDTGHYVNTFNLINFTKSLPEIHMEKGFLIFTKIMTAVSSSSQILLITSSFIILSSVFFLIYKYSKRSWLSVLIYVTGPFFFHLTGMRQSLAIAFILFSFHFILNRKLLFFILTIIFASAFHKSALLFMPAYFLFNFELNKKNIIITLSIAVSSFIFFSIFSQIFFYFFPQYQVYTSSVYYSGEIKSASIFKTLIAGIYVIFGFLIWFYKIIPNRNDFEYKQFFQTKLLLYFSFIAFLLQFISINATLLERASIIFSSFNIILYPNLISMVKNKNLKIFLILFLIFWVILYSSVILIFRSEWTGCIPYTFIWEV
ncbi:MAG: EpsG family protein [Endomicrobiaceae bacterium]